MPKLTKAQRDALAWAATGRRVEPGGMWATHRVFHTGEIWYGIPASTHRVLTKAGLLAENRITPAGRAALEEQNDER